MGPGDRPQAHIRFIVRRTQTQFDSVFDFGSSLGLSIGFGMSFGGVIGGMVITPPVQPVDITGGQQS